MLDRSHVIFIVIIITVSIVNLGIAAVYFERWHNHSGSEWRPILKPLPPFLVTIQTVVYLFLYNFHRYAVLLTIALLACSTGSVLIKISADLGDIYFLFAILSYSIMYVLLAVGGCLPPYRNQSPKCLYKKCIPDEWWKIFLSVIPTLAGIPFLVSLILALITSGNGLLIASVCMYVLSIIVASSSHVLRLLKKLRVSNVASLIGLLFLALSDTLLSRHTFIYPEEDVEELVLPMYWLGLTLLGLSVVITWKSSAIERDGVYSTENGTYDSLAR